MIFHSASVDHLALMADCVGKTYTMEGPADESQQTDENAGMIQRAVTQIFQTSDRLEEQGWKYDFEASFVEIYNETLRDLLVTQKKPAGAEEVKYDIKHDAKTGQTWVTNLMQVPVKSAARVHELLSRAAKNRAVSATNMNERSSRSHSVFQLRIKGRNDINKEEVEGLLNLIDLAGSERLDQSGATGNTMKETIAINSSLTNLGNCIQALANNDKHVPYRNSKLTYLLQNSLGGNSKTLMFVNISPAASNLRESVKYVFSASKCPHHNPTSPHPLSLSVLSDSLRRSTRATSARRGSRARLSCNILERNSFERLFLCT